MKTKVVGKSFEHLVGFIVNVKVSRAQKYLLEAMTKLKQAGACKSRTEQTMCGITYS